MMACQLCYVRHPAYSVSRELVVFEYDNCSLCYRDAGARIIFIFLVSGSIIGYQCRFHGRFFRSYLIRSNFSGFQYVSARKKRLLSFSSPPLHGNNANNTLWGWRVRPSLAVGRDTLYFPAAGFVVASPFKTSYKKSQI